MPDSSRIPIPNLAAWSEASIGGICVIISRGTAPTYVERSSVRAIGQRCVTEAGFNPSAARPHLEHAMAGVLIPERGDVLLNSTGTGTIGRSCVFCASGRFIVDGHVTLLRTNPVEADGRWLDAVLRTQWGQRYLETQCFSGSTNQIELSRSRLAEGVLPVPSLPEQRRIAEILDTLDEAIRRTEQIIAKLKQIKQGLLHDLLTRGIDENGELRDPERHPELFNGTRLGKLPRNWQIKPLQEVVSNNQYAIVDGPFGSNLKSIHYRRLGIPVIQSGYVTTGRFLASSYYYVTTALFNEQKRSRVDPGDIVMAKIGAQAGRCSVLPDDHPVGILAGNCLKITCDENQLMSQFLLAYLHRLYEVGGMRGLRAETAQPAISLSRLRRLLVPCPTPREQSSMLQSIGAVEARQQKEEEDLAKLSCLKKGLMEDLLTGRVRVTNLEAAA